MPKTLSILKFLTRFILALFFSILVFIGCYLSFWTDDIRVVEKTIEKITLETNLLKDYKIDFSEISEDWSMHGLKITAQKIKIKSKEMLLNAENVELTVDLIETFNSKSLKIKKINISTLHVEVLEKSLEHNKINIRNKTLDFLSIIDGLDFQVENLKVIDPKSNIKIENVLIKKNKFENSIFLYQGKKLKSFTRYDFNKETSVLSFKTELRTNNYYLTKIIEHTGQKEILDFIKINNIYSVIGDLTSFIDISINLKNLKINDYRAKIDLNGNKIVLNSYDPITLTNAIGSLYYDNKGFHTNKIVANLNKKRTTLKITQKKNTGLVFDFKTKLDENYLSKIANAPLNKIFKGVDDFYGTYYLNFNEADNLKLFSDFKTMKYKTKTNLKLESGLILDAYLDYKNEQLDFKINQGKNNVELKLVNNELYNLNIFINKKITKIQKEKGFFINGYLYDVSMFDLIGDFDDINRELNNSNNENNQDLSKPLKINIDLKNTKIKEMYFNDINLLYQNNSFSLLFNEENSVGDIHFNTLTNKLNVNIEKLKINTQKTKIIIKESESQEDLSSFNGISENIYEIDISAKSIIVDDKSPISIKTKMIFEKGILKSDLIDLYDDGKNIEFKSRYQYDLKRNVTTIMEIDDKTPILNINNVKAFKNGFIDKPSKFESKYIKIYGGFSWRGTKLIDMGKSINGYFTIDIGKGKLPKSSTRIGLAKALNIFNFDSLLQMFTFDFEDIEGGLPFNSIKGKIKIKDNILSVKPRIILDSDLFLLELKGDINYVNSTYNLTGDTVVPLANKAPLIAMFAGISPEIVGIMWVVDKIAGEELNNMFSRTRFDIKGTFENPIYKKNK